MFRRAIPRQAVQAVRRVPSTPVFTRGFVKPSEAPINESGKRRHADPLIKAEKVPVVSFEGGERTQLDIPVAKAASQPVNPPGADEHKRAVPLDREIISRLPPTMQKFTLPGKVAVITG